MFHVTLLVTCKVIWLQCNMCVCVFADFSSCISSTRMKPSTQARYFPSSSLISSHVFCFRFNTHTCLSFRSRSFGKCTRNDAGNSSPLETVSGNNMRTSSIKTHTHTHTHRWLLQWRLYWHFWHAVNIWSHTFLPSDASSFHQWTHRLIRSFFRRGSGALCKMKMSRSERWNPPGLRSSPLLIRFLLCFPFFW